MEAGAGVVGKYEHCSFRVQGVGTFRGGKGTKPFLGRTGQLEKVDETRLEMVSPVWKIPQVIAAMRSAHPYEEIAYDVHVLDNESTNYGAGAVGSLKKTMTLGNFLQLIKDRLKIPALRFTGNLNQKVKTVAVCGGSGSDLIKSAIHRGADVFVTADVKYHAFESAGGRIAVVDAGHYETEHPSLDAIVQYLRDRVAEEDERVQIFKTSIKTNSVQYY